LIISRAWMILRNFQNILLNGCPDTCNIKLIRGCFLLLTVNCITEHRNYIDIRYVRIHKL
jgi:hypothetical protein